MNPKKPLSGWVLMLTAILCVVAVVWSAANIMNGDASPRWLLGAGLGVVGVLACWAYVRAST